MEVRIATTLLLLAILPAVLTFPWEKWRGDETLKESQPSANFGKTREQAASQVTGVFDGCYSDTKAHILGKRGWTSESDENINANCVITCIEKGYTIAATQGYYCYCTNSLPLPQLHHANDGYAAGNGGPCSLTCPGAITTGDCQLDECCGGKNAYTVYKLGRRSDVNEQLFESQVQSMIGTNQPLEAKLQTGTEYSDIETPNFHLARAQSVGTFDGCYGDSESGALGGISGLEFQWSDNFNAKCQLECQENGYPIASTKGSYCYCTYSLPLPQIHRADDGQSAGITGPCNTTCPGSITTVACQGDECCGGPNATSVYIIGEIDALKQLQRRIVNKILTSSTLRLSILSDINPPAENMFDEFRLSTDCKSIPRIIQKYYSDFGRTVYSVPREGELDYAAKLRTFSSFVDDEGSININVDMNTDWCTFDRVDIELLVTALLVFVGNPISVQDVPSMTVGLINSEGQIVYSQYYDHSDYTGHNFKFYFTAPSTRASSIFIKTSPLNSDCKIARYTWSRVIYTINATGVRCVPSAQRIGVVVTGRGRTATSEGVGQSDTVYTLTYFKGEETLTSVPPTLSSLIETDKLNLEVIAMERLIESDDSSAVLEPFSDWDIACDNIFGATDITCGKEFSEAASFEESWSTEHGFNLEVTIGVQFEAGGLFASASTSFELSLGYSFTSGYSRTQTYERAELFNTEAVVPAGYKTEVRFFKSEIPVQIKWRATIFASGYVLVDILKIEEEGESWISEPIKLHLTQMLTASERELFSFGTIDYGERPTLISIVQTVDRDGNLLSQKEEEKPVLPDLTDTD